MRFFSDRGGFVLAVIVFAFLMAFTMTGTAYADRSVTLAWDANSEKDLAGYRIFYKEYGVPSFDYTNPVWEGTEIICAVVVPGDGQFVARAFDVAGNESGDSNVVVLDTPPEKVKSLLIQAIDLAVQAVGKMVKALAELSKEGL